MDTVYGINLNNPVWDSWRRPMTRKPSKLKTSKLKTYVVSAVFIRQTTIQAANQHAAFEVSEKLAQKGATVHNLCNWYAHEVTKK